MFSFKYIFMFINKSKR